MILGSIKHRAQELLRSGGLRLASMSCLVFFSGMCIAQSQVVLPDTARAATLRLEGLAHEHGEGVQKNPARAADLYCEAARLGDAEAQFSLGWMYANGRGVARADDVASFFFALAEKQGHEHARKMLRFVGDQVAATPACFLPPVPAAVAALPAPPAPQDDAITAHEFVANTPTQRRVLELVQTLAPQYGISPRLALAVISAESNFNPTAVSDKNAQGLMQLIPETAVRFNVTMPFDPAQNLRGGLAYLRWLLAYFQGNVPLVAAAYNAGEGAVNRYRGIPPFAETRGYVKRIMKFFGKAEHPYDATVTNPSPALLRIREAAGF
jgi:TPR repeat protein